MAIFLIKIRKWNLTLILFTFKLLILVEEFVIVYIKDLYKFSYMEKKRVVIINI